MSIVIQVKCGVRLSAIELEYVQAQLWPRWGWQVGLQIGKKGSWVEIMLFSHWNKGVHVSDGLVCFLDVFLLLRFFATFIGEIRCHLSIFFIKIYNEIERF